MDDERSQWHSDDELATALERALEISQTGAIPVVQSGDERDSGEAISDLFAALIEEPQESIQEPVRESVHESANVPQESREQVFESLDDFKPRTNFIPVIQPAEDSESVESAPPTSAAVTMPVQWTPERPSFDEVVFGVAALAR